MLEGSEAGARDVDSADAALAGELAPRLVNEAVPRPGRIGRDHLDRRTARELEGDAVAAVIGHETEAGGRARGGAPCVECREGTRHAPVEPVERALVHELQPRPLEDAQALVPEG